MSHCVPNWGVESSSLSTQKPPPGAARAVHLVPWFDARDGEGKAVATAATARDAVVPCAVSGEDEVEGVQVAPDSEGGCTRVGSCSGPDTWEFSRTEGSVKPSPFARVPVAEEEWSGVSAGLDMSDTFDSGRGVPTCETTSFFSLDNTFSSSWKSDTKGTTPSSSNDNSVFLSRKQGKETVDTEEKSNKKGKRSRCKTDQSQRKRREKIDERMRKLQRLVPTSKRQKEKDKEWVLDEVIEYVKQLQSQLQMMMMTMMMPIPMMMPHMPMDMAYRQNPALTCLFPAVYMPAPPWNVAATAYPQSHWRPTVEEAHSRTMAASLMQQQQFPFIFHRGNFF